MNKSFKRFISLVLTLVMVLGTIPMSATVAEAAGNIVINGVDIGYASGSFFTKSGQSCYDYDNYDINGKSCSRCHKRAGYDCTKTTDPSCNCMRYWPTGVKSTC